MEDDIVMKIAKRLFSGKSQADKIKEIKEKIELAKLEQQYEKLSGGKKHA